MQQSNSERVNESVRDSNRLGKDGERDGESKEDMNNNRAYGSNDNADCNGYININTTIKQRDCGQRLNDNDDND